MVAGLLLLFAGATKLSPIQSLAISRWIVLTESAAFSVGLVEFMLGWFCIAFLHLHILNWTVLGAFCIYSCVLLLKLGSGESSCQCLGGTSVPVVSMLITDFLVAISVLCTWGNWSRPNKIPSVLPNHIRNLQTMFPLSLIVLILLFGSVSAAMTFFSGQRLVVDSSSKFGGSVEKGDFVDVIYKLSNLSRQSVRVIGAKSSCSCLGVLDLPIAIGIGESKDVRVRLFGNKVNTLQSEMVALIFDDTLQKQMLVATALVVKAGKPISLGDRSHDQKVP